jgi:hypothetical protein
MYTDILWRIRDAVRRKGFEKWRTGSWLLLHDNAPAHRPVLIKDFLAKNNVTTLEHPPYSIDLTPAEFYLFPGLKSALKGWRFCYVTDIKNATEELKWLSQNSYQECVQHLYSRWQNCVLAQGDYFERNVAYKIVLFYISQKKVIPGTLWSYHVWRKRGSCCKYMISNTIYTAAAVTLSNRAQLWLRSVLCISAHNLA